MEGPTPLTIAIGEHPVFAVSEALGEHATFGRARAESATHQAALGPGNVFHHGRSIEL